MKREVPNVLIIDDSELDREILSVYLEDLANVRTVASGKEALECVNTYSIDIILLDIDMPEMDGFETLEMLRRQESCINVPTVLVTGICDRQTVLNSVVLGVDGYLRKPINKGDLREKIVELFNNKKELIGKKKTILLIDDDMVYLKQINNFLADNYNVIMINSSKLALEYLSRHVPDVIILDYQMPVYDGANVMSIIKNHIKGKEVPIIMLSGVDKIEVMRKTRTFNLAGYLSKPISKEQLEDKIEQVLNR